MVVERTPPDRGEEIDGYRAPISTGLSPRFWHYQLHDPNWRSAYLFLFLVTPLGPVLIWLGIKLLDVSHIKAMLLGVALCGVGGLMLLLGPILALGMAWMARKWIKPFRHGLLIPGVVVSSKPLAVVALADLGKDASSQGKEFALGRVDLWSLPTHSHEVGTRVPCVADFSEDCGDRYLYFKPYPVALGTGDPAEIEQCIRRLGDVPFQRLDALIARGPVPEQWNRIIVVDASDEVLEERGYIEAGEMRKAEEARRAAAQSGVGVEDQAG
jgi:hypothetical protein